MPQPSSKKAPSSMVKSPDSQPPDGLSVLVVEDEPVSAFLLSTLLTGSGYKVSRARTGKEVLDITMAETFSLILSDVNLPDMTCFEIVDKLRERPSFVFPPILLLTGETPMKIRDEAKSRGISVILEKGVENEVLISTVAKMISPG